MSDTVVNRVADWLNGSTPDAAAPTGEAWGLLEIMGHRQHYGRVTEVERFGAKFCRVDVPTMARAVVPCGEETFETHVYGGSAIFCFTPMTEQAARDAAERMCPRPYTPMARLPAPYDEDDEDERPF